MILHPRPSSDAACVCLVLLLGLDHSAKIWDSGWVRDVKIKRSESESPHSRKEVPDVSPKEGIQSLSEGFLYYMGPKSDYYGSRGVMTAKSGILGGLEMSKSREASQNPHIVP